MGMFKQRVRVFNSKKPELSFEEEFWVDSGALYFFRAGGLYRAYWGGAFRHTAADFRGWKAGKPTVGFLRFLD